MAFGASELLGLWLMSNLCIINDTGVTCAKDS